MSVNILDKTDKSFAPVPGVKVNGTRIQSVVKRSKFDWTTGGKKGVFLEIPKGALNIDGRYQRDQVSRSKVLDIARGWDWLMLGVISVIARNDGTYWVFDGGHRTRAAFFRDDVNELPCMVHEMDSLSDEAKAFFIRNTMVSNVSAISRYKAAVCASEPTANNVQAMLSRCGLVATDGRKDGSSILCIGEISRCAGIDEESTEKVLRFCCSLIRDDKPVSGMILRGLFTLYQRMKPRFDLLDKFGEKIASHSQRELEIKMRQFRSECGQGGATVEAKALLGVVNYKNKTRIEW